MLADEFRFPKFPPLGITIKTVAANQTSRAHTRYELSSAPRWRFPEIRQRLLRQYRDLPPTQRAATRLIQSIGNQDEVFVADGRQGLQGVALLRERLWDSEHFGFSVGSLEVLESFANSYRQDREIKSLLLDHMRSRFGRFRYLTCRILAEDLASANVLEAASFEYLTGMVTLAAECKKPLAKLPAWPEIRPFRKNELKDLVSIARKTFTQDRFHRDPGLPRSKSDQLHGEWIRNCCVNGLADVVLVCRSNGRLAGFIACRVERPVQHPGIGEIVLLGVAPGAQGKGIGSGLVRAALGWFQGRAETVLVRTEATNYASLRIYQKENFRLVCSSNYFRRWL